jgi:hypothetical protein
MPLSFSYYNVEHYFSICRKNKIYCTEKNGLQLNEAAVFETVRKVKVFSIAASDSILSQLCMYICKPAKRHECNYDVNKIHAFSIELTRKKTTSNCGLCYYAICVSWLINIGITTHIFCLYSLV